MTGNIHNRNVRFYEEKEADRRAWEILHSEEVKAFPSQNDFIIQAANLIKVDTESANLGATHVEKNVPGSFLMQSCF